MSDPGPREVRLARRSRRTTKRAIRVVSPLDTWWPDAAALRRFRRHDLGRRAVVLEPRDAAWRAMAPPFDRMIRVAESGVPVHVAVDGRQDARPVPSRVRAALAGGATVFLPQAHQLLPRLARLMVALRVTLAGAGRAECSFVFLVEGRGRAAMGLHHDGEVDAFWLQLDGRRTVTLGPRVARGTAEELDGVEPAPGRGWETVALDPGSLLHVPARTPHRVVAQGRSYAATLTWRRPRSRPPARAPRRVLLEWDVTSGRAEPWPSAHDPGRLWTQVPVVARRGGHRLMVATPDGDAPITPAAFRLASRLGAMPVVEVGDVRPRWIEPLIALGVLADEDLPQLVVPDDPSALDGWKF